MEQEPQSHTRRHGGDERQVREDRKQVDKDEQDQTAGHGERPPSVRRESHPAEDEQQHGLDACDPDLKLADPPADDEYLDQRARQKDRHAETFRMAAPQPTKGERRPGRDVHGQDEGRDMGLSVRSALATAHHELRTGHVTDLLRLARIVEDQIGHGL